MSALITFATLEDKSARTLLYCVAAAENACNLERPQYLHVYADADHSVIAGIRYDWRGAACYPIEAFDDRVLEDNLQYLEYRVDRRFAVIHCDTEFFVLLVRAGVALDFGASALDVGDRLAGLRYDDFESRDVARAFECFCTRHRLRSN